MKLNQLLFSFTLLLSCSSFLLGQSLEDKIDLLYAEHLEEGKVDYSKLKQNTAQLDALLIELRKVAWEQFEINDRQAFLINAYNLYVLKAILDRYPISSPKAINRFFTQKKYKLSQKLYSLDQIEKNLLFGEKRDARFHLVLICGAISCPPFWPKAFRGDQLENQLEEATSAAINSDWISEKNGALTLSEIFTWYAYDFGNVFDFINKYRINKISTTAKIEYPAYNWSLNEYLSLGSQPAPFLTASQLMAVGTWEIKAFQSTYTQVQEDGFGRDNSRSTYFSSFNQILTGVSPNLNVGLDIVWKKNDVNNLSSESWTKVFNQESVGEYLPIPCKDSERNYPEGSPCFTTTDNTSDVLRNNEGDSLLHQVSQGLSHLGPKVKFRPFSKIPVLTFQQTLYIPIDKEVDGQLISYSQFFYDQRLGAKTSLFGELSFWTPLRPTFRITPFIKTFWSYFPNRHFSVYGMVAFPGELGAGLKINLTRRLELELLTTKYLPNERFFGGRRANTFNIGLRLHP